MGTRALTVLMDGDLTDKEIAVLYNQFDGYPTGVGRDLKDFLLPFTVVNGIPYGDTRKLANGMPCLAAQLVAHFKGTEAGSVYLYPAGTRDAGEEYVYTVYAKKVGDLPPGDEGAWDERPSVVHLRVQTGSVTFFGLPGTKQDNMPVLYDGPVAGFDPEQAERVRDGVADDIPNDFLNAAKADDDSA